MRQFVVSEAPVSRVAQHVRDIVEDEGGIVAHHTAHKTEFDHLDYGDQAWRRAGYVGTYQHFKEKPVQVRIRVWAQWPRRLLLGSIYGGFAMAVLFFLASLIEIAIPPNGWIFTALPFLAAIAISLILYTSSVPESKGAEESVEADLAERIAEDDEIPGEIFDVDAWEDHRERLVEQAREDAKERAPHGGSTTRKVLASAKASLSGAGSSSQTEPEDETEDTSFLDRVKPGSSEPEDETDEDEPDRDAESEALEAGAEEDEDEDEGLLDRLPFVGSSEGDDEPEEAEEDEADEDPDEASGGLLDRLPFGGSGEEDDEPEEGEDAADDGDADGEAEGSQPPEDEGRPAQD